MPRYNHRNGSLRQLSLYGTQIGRVEAFSKADIRFDLFSLIPNPLLLAGTLYSPFLHAQDQRLVTEPVKPTHICATLTPLAASSSENDTQRLQAVIDHCQARSAVKLSGGWFFSGPLNMKSGVTGELIFRGYDAAHTLDITLDGVHFGSAARWLVKSAQLQIGNNGVSPPMPGSAYGTPAYSHANCTVR